MIPCLNPATTGGAETLEGFIKLAAEAGFSGIEFGLEPVARIAQEASIEEAKNLFARYQIRLGAFGLPVEWRRDQETFQAGLKELPKLCQIAQEIDCPRTITWIPPASQERPFEENMKFTVARLSQVAKILADYDIAFGIEFVGPKTSRNLKHEFIYTMDQALELGEKLGGKKVGLLLDSFHWHCTEGTYEDIVKVPAEKIVHVHINDAPNVPVDKQMDFQRLLPGEGIIDLVSFLRALKSIGYKDFISIETFNEELRQRGPQVAAKQAKEALDKVMAKI